MEDRETARMRKYGESKTTRIMMATVTHVTSGLGLRKFQADGFFCLSWNVRNHIKPADRHIRTPTPQYQGHASSCWWLYLLTQANDCLRTSSWSFLLESLCFVKSGCRWEVLYVSWQWQKGADILTSFDVCKICVDIGWPKGGPNHGFTWPTHTDMAWLF